VDCGLLAQAPRLKLIARVTALSAGSLQRAFWDEWVIDWDGISSTSCQKPLS